MISLADFCIEQGRDPREAVRVMQALNDRQVLHCAVEEARVARASRHPLAEARPLLEDGHEYGRVEARIPAAHFYQLMQQDNFGYAGLTSDEGMRDVLKRWPQFKVKTVSGNIVGVGFGSGRRKVKSYNL